MEEERVITVEEGGYACRLERWFSDYENEWFTGVTVFHEGREFFHSGLTSVEMTEEAARAEIGHAKALAATLQRFGREG